MSIKRHRVILVCDPAEDRAKQSHKDECDMNRIVNRVLKSGYMPLESQDSLRRAVYADVSDYPRDLQAAYDIVQRADVMYAQLPARVRDEFRTPAELMAFLDNPANLEKAIEMGIVAKQKAGDTGVPPPPPAKTKPRAVSVRNSEPKEPENNEKEENPA